MAEFFHRRVPAWQAKRTPAGYKLHLVVRDEENSPPQIFRLCPTQDRLVIGDGKALRYAHVELVSAVNGAGRWLDPVTVPEPSNEIPAARELPGRVDLCGKTVMADARHTQPETMQQIIFAGGGGYVLTVKAN